MSVSRIKIAINKNGNEYVGVDIADNILHLHLPIGYDCEYHGSEISIDEINDDFKYEIKKLLQLLCKKRTLLNKCKEDNINFDFISAIKIVDDYNNYGLYKEMELLICHNTYSGRINWQKTIQNNKKFFHGKIVYDTIISERVNYNSEKIIKDIQEFCLYSISSSFGFLIGFNYPKIVCNLKKAEITKILNEEYNKTNVDIKKEMLSNMLEYIKNTSFNFINNGTISIKYKEFEYVFQYLIDYYGIKDKSRYNPRSKYMLWKDKTLYYECRPSQPDTIVYNNDDLPNLKNTVFILDAKYRNGLPDEYDIFKQIRYKKYLMLKIKSKYNKMYNIFVLPSNLKENNKIVKIADFYATSEDYEKKEKIYVVYVDTKNLILNTSETMKTLLYEVSTYKYFKEIN